MNLLKRIPIKYIGELHDIRLINFSVHKMEFENKLPSQFRIRDFNGRALISMVDVKLKRMHPEFIPGLFNFNYRHVAFRLLIDDGIYNKGEEKGIYFYRSFTNKPLMVAGGKLLTDYNLERAAIEEKERTVLISQGINHVKYSVGEEVVDENDDLKQLRIKVGAIDRAYSILGNKVRVTQIQRERWPIQSVKCWDFENTFFETAKLEGAFRVFETIHYQWLPPKEIDMQN